MKKMKLREFWDTRDKTTTNKILSEIAEICGKSIQTIQAWMLGYRNPDKLEREAVANYIRKTFQVEIIEEGGSAKP